MLDPACLSPVWKGALSAAGLVPAADEPLRFDAVEAEARAASTGTVMAPLAHLAPIAVGGDDRVGFLQGQSSNDVRLVEANRAQLTSVNTPKGRVFALGVLHAAGDRLLLWTEAALAEALRKRLQMYVLRAKATLADARAERLAIGLSGAGTAAALHAADLLLPDAVWGAHAQREVAALRLPGDAPRVLVSCPAAEAPALLRAFATHATPVGTAAWRLTDVLAGLPTVLPETQELWVAQMLDLDRAGGIHFDKGCYTGQEIVARMHYLGRLKQRLYRARSGAAATHGAPVHAGKGGQSIGEVVVATPDGAGGHALLAVLRHEHAGAALFIDDSPLSEVVAVRR